MSLSLINGNKSVVYDTQPASRSSGYGDSFSGKGSNATEQGMQTITAKYDKTAIDNHNRIASGNRTLYQKPEKPESYDIVDGEFAFTHKMPRSEVTEDKYSVHCVTSLNSVGADAISAFPNDEEMAVEVVRNSIKYAGIARDTVTYSGGNKRQGLALQIAGISSHFANYDSAPGFLAELVVPKPSSLNLAERKRKPHVPVNKVVLEVRPYNPRTIEAKVMAHLRNYLDDEAKYKRAMNTKYRTTQVWINFIDTLFHSDIVTWAMMTSGLQSAGVIKPIELNDNPVIRDLAALGAHTDDEPLHGDKTVLVISKCLGILPTPKPDGTDIHSGIKILAKHVEFFNGLKRQLMQKVHYDGRIANLEFGYDRQTRTNPAKDDKTHRPKMSTPAGRMLYNQLNHTPMVLGAMSDAVSRNQEWVTHKIIKGAPEGRVLDLVK